MREAIQVSEARRRGSLSSRLTASTTILVVEDEEDIATFLGAYFRASGYAMVHIDPLSPDQVAEAVTEHQPACVLLDLGLRGFHGLEAYRRIREEPTNAVMPVIVVSADVRPASRHAALEGGVDAFVTKPFKVQELFELVEERIGRSAVRAEVATADSVTGVGTHAHLHERLADEVALAGESGRPCSFGLVRLCSLREINERAGHTVGDFVLREVARRLQAALSTRVFVGRNTGAEFGVVLPDTSADAARDHLTAALDAASHEVPLPDGHPMTVVVKAGVAAHPQHAWTADELYMSADAALAEAIESPDAVVLAR